MRLNARLDMYHHGSPHPSKDAGVVPNSLTGIRNVMAKCLFVVNKSCIHNGFYVFPTGKNAEHSNLESVDRPRSGSSIMVGVIENISESMAKMCQSTIIHVPDSCSACQWYIFQ
jgi:hypothetical protein